MAPSTIPAVTPLKHPEALLGLAHASRNSSASDKVKQDAKKNATGHIFALRSEKR